MVATMSVQKGASSSAAVSKFPMLYLRQLMAARAWLVGVRLISRARLD